MPLYATLGQIKLRKNLFFRTMIFKLQPIALLAWQNFIAAKSGCLRKGNSFSQNAQLLNLAYR
jgi:hypothetical protein